MYFAILAIHNLVRWLVVAAGIWAVVRCWRGWVTRSQWTPAHAGAVKLFVNVLSLQFLIGLIVYGVSPLIREAMSDMGAAMGNAPVRYFVVEHAVVMILAVALAHIGSARVRRAQSDSARFQTATIWMGFALAAVVGFIPWTTRPLFPSF
ncbi:MAG: hypothetical protein ABIZ91_02135 [Gemmatimonadaceae bacterium]